MRAACPAVLACAAIACGSFASASASEGGEVERYRFLPSQPRYLMAAIDLRDAAGVLWPSMIGGRGAGGELRLTADGLTGQFAIRTDIFGQAEGDQSRRVLGDLVADKKGPVVELRITEVQAAGQARTAEAEMAAALDGASPSAARPEPPRQVTLVGRFTLGDRSIPVSIPASVRRVEQTLSLAGHVTVPGADLGLRPTSVTIHIEAGGTRHPDDLKAPAKAAAADSPELDLR